MEPTNPPEFAEAEEPRKSRIPAVIKRFPLVLILFGAFIMICLFLFTRGHKPPVPREYGGVKAASLGGGANTITSPPFEGARPSASPTSQAEVARVEPMPTTTSSPAPVETVRYEQPSVPRPTPSTLPPRRYQVVLRAGIPDEEAERAVNNEPDLPEAASAPEEAQPQEQGVAKETPLPIGTVLPLKLLNPLLVVPSSATHGRVRVTQDVKVSDELTIPAGSEGYISMVQLEGSDRVVVDSANPGFIKVGDVRYSLTGMVLGRDQYVGLKGKRERIEGTGRPNIAKRVAGQLAQQVTGRVGIYAGDVIDIYGRGGAAQYLLKVPADTLFTLTTGLK